MGERKAMKEKIFELGNDPVMPQQFLDGMRRSEPLQPERALLLAVLEDAIHCYHKDRAAQDRARRQRYLDAERWIMLSGNDWIFSFDNVCELLGIDPQFLRRGLQSRRRRHKNHIAHGTSNVSRRRVA
jgi:hypothetical protein